MSATRAIAWRHAIAERVCDDIRPWEHGTVVRATSFPTFYQYNLVRVEGPDPGLDAEALAAATNGPLDGLAHRRIEIEDLAAGERVREGFEAMGWVVERLAFLHRELPAPERAAQIPAELKIDGFEASRSLRLAWRDESSWGDPLDFYEIEEAVAARLGSRSVVAYVEGDPAGFSAFAAHGDTMEVELVFCRPERRNGGLGAAVVSRALAVAAAEGARHALIEADDDGDSKRLYERLGFETIWVRHSFTRRPPAT